MKRIVQGMTVVALLTMCLGIQAQTAMISTDQIPVVSDQSLPPDWPVVLSLPANTAILQVEILTGTVTVDFGPELLGSLDEAVLTGLFNEIHKAFALAPEISSIRMTCKGQLLSYYLPPVKPVGTSAPSPGPMIMPDGTLATQGLSGRNITIGPSHGRYWNESYGWLWQRTDPCGLGEAVLEDTNSIRLMQFLYQYLAQDGAAVHVPRELNEANCCHSGEGQPWWKMAARYWLQANGLPASVWDSSTTDSNDDIRCRPLFADYRGSDIYLACHTNAGGGGTATGTETWRDSAMEHPAHVANSLNLANNIQSSVVDAIRTTYPGAGGWANRGVKDIVGGFGEIRIPDRPAILIELAFHDGCVGSNDAAYLTDNFFRSTAEWGLYRGVCQYFGTSPTWDKYSDEFVSDTIPTTMISGQVYPVSITFRNRGVVWSESRSFRLGTVGDSDPFVGATRFTISGEVRPGNTYTWNFNMTAPAAGDHVSDWQLVRDGYAWFGAVLTKNIHVNPSGPDTEPPTQPTNLVAVPTAPTSVQLNWTASSDNVGVTGYDIRRDGSIIGSSTTNSYTDNTAIAQTAHVYEVRAKDAVPNYSAWSASATVDIIPPSKPTNLVANPVSSTSVQLSWTASTDDVEVTGYDIRRDGTVIGSSAITTYTDNSVLAIHTYTYDVRARDAVPNYSAWSDPVTVTTPDSGGVGGCGGSDNNQGSVIGSYSMDWTGNPNQGLGGFATQGDCGYTAWYTYVDNTSCTNFQRWAQWAGLHSLSGRGWLVTDIQVPCAYATTNTRYTLMNSGGGDQGTTVWLDQCPRNGWYNLHSAGWGNLADAAGWRIHTLDTTGGSGCNGNCGYKIMGAAGLHMYGARWHYVNDWVCLGGYSSGAIADTHGFDEATAYLYPAIDTTHGNVIGPALFNGKVPGRVITGDCNNANSLNFKGNANSHGGGDNMDAYGFAWAYAPAGAGPKLLIGSDDGVRVWVNGNLVHDNGVSRGLTRDQDETAGIGFSAGWNRILFKVHNGTGGFEGTLSLRNGSDYRWNEPSVNVFDMGGYYSYGIGYEQDCWYPCIDVGSFYGTGNPQPNGDHYGNITTVTASGTASGNNPVPFWKVMHFEWGYGISGDTDYTDVSSSGVVWSHTETGVAGHRRFHFFAVSQSGRTSFQNSGVSGGWNFADDGPANYIDVYVDNVAPANASFSSVTAVSTTQIDLTWAIPDDQGVGVGPGSTEYASEGGDNAYRRGDVGVRIYRDGSGIGGWDAGTALDDVGLEPNTPYTYTIEARDNTGEGRGAWHNTTGQQGSTVMWTLSVPPTEGSVTADNVTVCAGDDVTWTVVGGFGAGKVQKYKYAWHQDPTHTWSGAESDWSDGTIVTSANAPGNWYLHVLGFNGLDVPNGAYVYPVTVQSCEPPAVLAAVSRKVHGEAGAFDMDVQASNAIECRKDGPTQLIVSFSKAVYGHDGLDPGDVSLSNGTVTGVSIDANTLTINMTGTADAATLTVGLLGIEDQLGQAVTEAVVFGVLLGDVNRSRNVNLIDVAAVKTQYGSPVDAANFKYDIDLDGVFSLIDVAMTRSRYGNAMP